jgi:hypothetical protein
MERQWKALQASSKASVGAGERQANAATPKSNVLTTVRSR